MAVDLDYGGHRTHFESSSTSRVTVKLLTSRKITCAASFLGYLFLVDFPEKADQSWRFLNKDERDFILRRIKKDRDDAMVEPFTFRRFLAPARELELWIFGLIFL